MQKPLKSTFFIENEYSNNEITILICLQSTKYQIFGYPLSALAETNKGPFI